MANDDDLSIGVTADTGDAEKQLDDFADALDGIGESASELISKIKALTKQTEDGQKANAGFGKASKDTASAQVETTAAVNTSTDAFKAQTDALREAEAAHKKYLEAQATGTTGGTDIRTRADKGTLLKTAEAEKPGAGTAALKTERAEAERAAKANAAFRIKAQAEADKEIQRQATQTAKLQMQLSNEVARVEKANAKATEAMFKQQDATIAKSMADSLAATKKLEAADNARASKAKSATTKSDMSDWDNQFKALEKDIKAREQATLVNSNLRYAMHDVASTMAVVGSATIGVAAATIGMAAKYESAMANVTRTNNLTTAGTEEMKNAFLGLSQEIPVAFGELAEIGTLAGQLGITGATNVENFTETVAKFASVTDVSTESAATALGRLDTLLNDSKGGYDELGSAILEVGVNSLATESEIIATASQIASVGKQANFTAAGVIGLAGSFASLGVAPESARGTTLRAMSQINTAVAMGGEGLEKFASLAGKTSEEFVAAWSKSGNSAATFGDVLAGIKAQGGSAETVIRSLGITATRDVNSFLKLSDNVEVYRNNLESATRGVENHSAVDQAFGIIAETLTSKLQILGQSFSGLVATLGEGTTGPLGTMATVLNAILVATTELAKNPFVQWVAGIATAAAIGAGAITLLFAAVARGTASAIAFRQIWVELALAFSGTSVAAVGAAGSITGLSLAQQGAAITGRALAASMTLLRAASGPVGLALTAVVAAIATISHFAKSSEADVDKVTSAFGRAKTAMDMFAVVGENNAPLQGVTEDAKRFNDQLLIIADSSGTVWERIRAGFATTGEASAGFQEDLAEIDGQLKAIAEVDMTEAIDRFNVLADATDGSDKSLTSLIGGMSGLQEEILAAAGAAGVVVNGLSDTEEQALALALAMGTAGHDSELFESSLNAVEDAAYDAADAAYQLGQDIDDAFAAQDSLADFADSFADLVEGVATGGEVFSLFTEAGRENMGNLQTVIKSAIENSANMGVSAAEAVGIVFQQLNLSAGTTASLLSQLGGMGIPNFDVPAIQSYLDSSRQLTTAGSALSAGLRNVAAEARANAAETRESSKENRDAAKSEKDRAKATKESEEELRKSQRTLKDYSSDLKGVFDRVYELRFSVSNTKDATQSIVNTEIAAMKTANDAVTEATAALKTTNKEKEQALVDGQESIATAAAKTTAVIREQDAVVKGLTADKSILEYWKTVADKYGDTLRSGQITGEIAEIDNKIAESAATVDAAKKAEAAAREAAAKSASEEAEKVAKAQSALASATQAAYDKNNKSVNGNTQAAIDNRSQLQELTTSYGEQLVALADTGLSQDELKRKSEILRGEFRTQAAQMGYSKDAIGKAEGAFKDITTTIGLVPRNVSIKAEANTSAAKTAMAEFAIAAEKSAKSAKDNVNNQLSKIKAPPLTFTPTVGKMPNIPKPKDQSFSIQGVYNDAGVKKAARGAALLASLDAKVRNYQNALKSGADNTATRYMGEIISLKNTLNGGNYWTGGYTGPGGKKQFAGNVHKGEFVVDAENTSRLGLPFLNALNAGNTPVVPQAAAGAGASTGIMVVELSATDRSLLRAAGNVQLQIGNQVVASATNSANTVSALRGA